MSFSPARVGCLVVAAVVAAAAIAQAASSPSRSHASDDVADVAGRPTTRTHVVTVPARKAVRPSTRETTHRKSNGKVIYLTFDDGPSNRYTPSILEVLAKHHARATFFALGLQIGEFPDLIPRIKASGHTVGNHTYDHKDLTALSAAEVRREFERGPRSTCFRPPFRKTNNQVTAIAASYGMRQVLWTVDTADWSTPGTASIESKILSGARPGAVVLLHDGGGDRSQTVAALDHVLSVLAERGYAFKALAC